MEQTKGIVVLDIDGTILQAHDSNILIGKKYPDGHTEYISSCDWEQDPDLDNPDIVWDYSQCEDIDAIKQSILNANPIIGNLKIMDEKILEGWDVCFLTARSQKTEQVLYDALSQFLKVNDGTGQLKPIGTALNREMCAAIGADNTPHNQVPFLKCAVLKKICSLYDQVIFIDDDDCNLVQAQILTNTYSNLQVIKSLKESTSTKITPLPQLKGQMSVIKIGIEDNNMQCVVGFKDKKYWFFTYDRDISTDLEEAAIFDTVTMAQEFIESITIGELPKQGLVLHIVKLEDAYKLC